MKKTLLFLIAFFLFSTTTLYSEEKIILFHSETCGYCKDVIEVIEKHNLMDVLNLEMVEESEEGAAELFANSLEECDIDPSRSGYPTLYHNGECSIGSYNAIVTLLSFAGIEDPDFEDIEIEEGITEIDQEETARILKDLAVLEQEETEREPRPFWHFVVMVIGPAILVGIAYFMIKKLNL